MFRKVLFAAAAAAAFPMLAPVSASAQDAGESAIDLILDARLRYEFVDQAGFAENAQALTLRTRLGFETPKLAGFSALLEIEALEAVIERYNDTLNRKTTYPQVGDPEGVELNRASLNWSGEAGQAVLGRQRIQLDNQRFFGTSSWRQREQTFDAVLVEATFLKPLTLRYGYVDQVNRTVGPESPTGTYDSDSHLGQAEVKTPVGKLVGYGYLIDLKNAATLSNQTYGARLVGDRKMGDTVSLTWAGEYAQQSDYGSTPLNFDLDYVLAEGGLKTKGWSLLAQMERLDGNGQTGFMTPLGSGHSFHGWSDAIQAAPGRGLLDLNIKASAEVPGLKIGKGVKVSAAAYDFSDADGDADFGREFNASAGAKLTDHVTAEIKAAVFDGETPAYADRTKVWASVEVKY